MRTPIQLYDQRGLPIKVGDMLRVFHFRDYRRWNHWMYKQVYKRDGFWAAKHYPFTKDDGYDLQCQADEYGILRQYEIIDCTYPDDEICFQDRPRVEVPKLPKSNPLNLLET